MLIPNKVKHRKWQKGRSFGGQKGTETRGITLAFGNYGLKALESNRVSSRQLEASRRLIMRYLKKGGKLWIRIFPFKPITNKGVEVPMGGSKGAVSHYVFPVRPGRIIFEMDGVPKEIAQEALEKAGDKLPVKTKFVTRNNI